MQTTIEINVSNLIQHTISLLHLLITPIRCLCRIFRTQTYIIRSLLVFHSYAYIMMKNIEWERETKRRKKEIKSEINSEVQESRCALKIGFIFINYLELHAKSSSSSCCVRLLLISYSSKKHYNNIETFSVRAIVWVCACHAQLFPQHWYGNCSGASSARVIVAVVLNASFVFFLYRTWILLGIASNLCAFETIHSSSSTFCMHLFVFAARNLHSVIYSMLQNALAQQRWSLLYGISLWFMV